MKKIFTLALSTVLLTLNLKAQYAADNFSLAGQLNPEQNFNSSGNKYSGCWGWYQQSTGREYAIACSQTGTHWIDITNPSALTAVAFQAGASSNATWREVKTYQNYCYVITDDQGAQGLQIFDMSNLPTSVTKVYQSKTLFSRGHACWVDKDMLYVSGITYSTGATSAMNIYSLATPTNPVLIRSLAQDAPSINYVHDMFVRNDTIYASCGYQGLYVYKRNANNSLTQLGSLTNYPGSGYNHSSALTPNGQTLVFMDEVPASLPIKVANVTNLANIQVLATTNQYSLTTPHNPFMINNQYVVVSSYQDGVQLYDISAPSSPSLAAYFDTYPQGGGNTGNYGSGAYNGQWGCYPFYPSKNIFCLDMKNGVFVIQSRLLNPIVSLSNNGNTELSNIMMYPNPSSSNLTIKLPQSISKAEIKVSNSIGQIVYTTSIFNEGINAIELNDLTNGIYVVTISDVISKNSINRNLIISK